MQRIPDARSPFEQLLGLARLALMHALTPFIPGTSPYVVVS